MKELNAHFKNKQQEKSAIAKHAIEMGHQFTKCSLLKQVTKASQLDAYETIYIKKNQHLFTCE